MATNAHVHPTPARGSKNYTDALSVFLLILLIALVVGVVIYIWGLPGGNGSSGIDQGESDPGTEIKMNTEEQIRVPETETPVY